MDARWMGQMGLFIKMGDNDNTGRVENMLGLYYRARQKEDAAISFFWKSADKHFGEAFANLAFSPSGAYADRKIELLKKAIWYGEDRACMYSKLTTEMLARHLGRTDVPVEERVEAHNYLIKAVKKHSVEATMVMASLYLMDASPFVSGAGVSTFQSKNYPAARYYANKAREILPFDVDYVDKTKFAADVAAIEKKYRRGREDCRGTAWVCYSGGSDAGIYLFG